MTDSQACSSRPTRRVRNSISALVLLGAWTFAGAGPADAADDLKKLPVYELQRSLDLPRLTPLIQGAQQQPGQTGGSAEPQSVHGGAAGSTSIAQATDVFLYLEGVSGPATHSNYAGWVRLLGMHEEIASRGTAQGGGTAQALSRPLTITKPVDSASVPLRRAAASGQYVPLAAVAFVRGGQPPAELFRIVLENVRVTRVDTRLREDKVEEAVDLVYDRVRWQFNLVFGDGRSGGTLEDCWDFRENRPC